jgi:glycosyltransferase involved in cell wall biosynthesis
MGIELSVYATVYNNAYIVEKCVRSLFNALPDIDELVVVDNYSTDGTYEILLELGKEYPIRVYRYRCSRGLGRQLAFNKTRGRYVMYIDMDTVFDKQWGYVVKHLLNETSDNTLWNYFGLTTRRTVELIGGWRDQNYGEDWEFIARAIKRGVEVRIPTVPSFCLNVKKAPTGFGEYRYVRNRLSLAVRLLKNFADNVRGCGIGVPEVIYREKEFNLKTLAYLAISSIFTFPRSRPSCTVIVYRYSRYFLPEEVGLPKDWFLAFWGYIDVYWSYIKDRVFEVIKRARNLNICVVARGLLMYRSIDVAKGFLEGFIQSISKRFYMKIGRVVKSCLHYSYTVPIKT